jgi:pimeloyl-ACP methyl ester carboxylesterase
MRVLLVPGGGAPVAGYFPEDFEQSLSGVARLIGFDAPGFDAASGRRWLPLPDQAQWLGDAVRRDGPGRVIVVGHSLGSLVALRLALDEPEIVAGLLLLDPSPPPLGALVPRPALELIAAGCRTTRWLSRASRMLSGRRSPLPAARSVPLSVRLRWFLLGGVAVTADVAAGGISGVHATIVSAGSNGPGSATRRSHERLARWIPGASFEVWPGTTHPLHLEEPVRVAVAAADLLNAAASHGDSSS